MRTNYINGIVIKYEEQDAKAAALIASACSKTCEINQDHWGMPVPRDCQVFVMHSWQWYLWNAAPALWKPFLIITFPAWYSRVKKIWPIAGGWEQQFGSRHTVGVKTPSVLEGSDRRQGERIFYPEEDLAQKVEHITCHELTHAFASDLKLPHWLKEGLSMLTVDLYAGQQTVKHDTLESLKDYEGFMKPGYRERIELADPEAVVYLYTRGYWITRYLDEAHPEALRALLVERLPQDELENRISACLGLHRYAFWSQIDRIVIDHYTNQAAVPQYR